LLHVEIHSILYWSKLQTFPTFAQRQSGTAQRVRQGKICRRRYDI
jgi:hypothetical protein